MSLIRWLTRGVIFLIWGLFPGILLAPAIGRFDLFDWVIGIAIPGVSIVFWRGVRTWPAGRRLTNAALAFSVKD